MCDILFINKLNIAIVTKSLWYKWSNTLQTVRLHKHNPLHGGNISHHSDGYQVLFLTYLYIFDFNFNCVVLYMFLIECCSYPELTPAAIWLMFNQSWQFYGNSRRRNHYHCKVGGVSFEADLKAIRQLPVRKGNGGLFFPQTRKHYMCFFRFHNYIPTHRWMHCMDLFYTQALSPCKILFFYWKDIWLLIKLLCTYHIASLCGYQCCAHLQLPLAITWCLGRSYTWGWVTCNLAPILAGCWWVRKYSMLTCLNGFSWSLEV